MSRKATNQFVSIATVEASADAFLRGSLDVSLAKDSLIKHSMGLAINPDISVEDIGHTGALGTILTVLVEAGTSINRPTANRYISAAQTVRKAREHNFEAVQKLFADWQSFNVFIGGCVALLKAAGLGSNRGRKAKADDAGNAKTVAKAIESGLPLDAIGESISVDEMVRLLQAMTEADRLAVVFKVLTTDQLGELHAKATAPAPVMAKGKLTRSAKPNGIAAH